MNLSKFKKAMRGFQNTYVKENFNNMTIYYRLQNGPTLKNMMYEDDMSDKHEIFKYPVYITSDKNYFKVANLPDIKSSKYLLVLKLKPGLNIYSPNKGNFYEYVKNYLDNNPEEWQKYKIDGYERIGYTQLLKQAKDFSTHGKNRAADIEAWGGDYDTRIEILLRLLKIKYDGYVCLDDCDIETMAIFDPNNIIIKEVIENDGTDFEKFINENLGFVSKKKDF